MNVLQRVSGSDEHFFALAFIFLLSFLVSRSKEDEEEEAEDEEALIESEE